VLVPVAEGATALFIRCEAKREIRSITDQNIRVISFRVPSRYISNIGFFLLSSFFFFDMLYSTIMLMSNSRTSFGR